MTALNISKYADTDTARTCVVCADQRAENLAILGVRTVLELCVGPSLGDLAKSYAKYGITVIGNDIDPRWRDFYPQGKWVIGDAISLVNAGPQGLCEALGTVEVPDAIVVAPPLSRGCSGRRNDSLSIDEVFPSFYDFLRVPSRVAVYVLPGRTLSLRDDRTQLFRFLDAVEKHRTSTVEVVPLRKKITKYVDVYAVS